MKLSNRQIKAAQQVGGIELMLPWPHTLGPEPKNLEQDRHRDAAPAEKLEAERIVDEVCKEHDLVPVHTRVANTWRPRIPGKSNHTDGAYRVQLAVTIIDRRWVHASTSKSGKVVFAELSD